MSKERYIERKINRILDWEERYRNSDLILDFLEKKLNSLKIWAEFI